MYAILRRKLISTFKFRSKRIIPIGKINIFVGANNSGKSFFIRTLSKDIIAIKENKYIISQIDKYFKTLNYDILPYELIEELNISELPTEFFRLKTNIDYLNENYQEDKSVSFVMLQNGRKYPIFFKDKVKADKVITDIYALSDKLNFKIMMNFDSNDCKGVIDKLVPAFINKFNIWIHTDLSSLVNKSVAKIHIIEKILENSDMFKNLISEYDQTKGHISYPVSEDNHITEDVREKLMIPVVRSLRHPIKKVDEIGDFYNENPYKDRYISEYNISEEYIEVFSGLDLYQRYKTALLGTIKERENIKRFEGFLSNMFFENRKISIIPDERTHELKINIEGDEDRPLYNVGDGVSSLIILFFNMFVGSKKRKYIFIEEPEQNMHPGLQRLFMDTISNSDFFNDYVFFFTTHSNHIIDTSINNFDNKRLFHVARLKDVIEVNSQSNSAGILLDSLGVLPSSLFLSNSAIWIEGNMMHYL